LDGVGIATVGDDETVGLGEIGHGEGLTEAVDAVGSLSGAQVEDFHGFLLFGSKEQAIALEVEAKMVEIAGKTGHRSGRDQS